eukprot:6641-Heterococcus_DN1.PRE.1
MISTENWRDMDGKSLFIGASLSIDTETELLACVPLALLDMQHARRTLALFVHSFPLLTNRHSNCLLHATALVCTAAAHCSYWYKVALLVFWPKGDTLNVMLKADFAAGMRTAEGLVDAELNNNNNNNSRGSRAVNKVVNYYCSTVTAVVSPPVPEHYYVHGLANRPCDQLQLVLALCCRLGGATGELCAQRALRALITVGVVITEACAAAIATAVGSLGWTVLGDVVLAVVRSTQLVGLDSLAALALKLSLLSVDKR